MLSTEVAIVNGKITVTRVTHIQVVIPVHIALRPHVTRPTLVHIIITTHMKRQIIQEQAIRHHLRRRTNEPKKIGPK